MEILPSGIPFHVSRISFPRAGFPVLVFRFRFPGSGLPFLIRFRCLGFVSPLQVFRFWFSGSVSRLWSPVLAFPVQVFRVGK